MADIIKVLPLSGLDEKGRDCYIVEINNDIFVLDCGTVAPDKTIPGVDFLLPNAKYLIENKSRLKGYFITHGHDENMAALKYFYKDAQAPIFCSKATRMIMEKQAEIQGVKVDFHFYEVKPSDEIVVANRKIIFFQTTHNCCYSSAIAIDTDKGYIVYTGDFIVDYSLKNKAFQFDLKQLSKISEKETFLLLAESKTADKPGYCSPKHEVASKVERYFKQDKRLFI
ncbi:MAG: MBL fold metallo-hydrolase, partial [Bacilli bacterium]|nr:MBL fold metallo-hydrolase [Bacilli bacterium]